MKPENKEPGIRFAMRFARLAKAREDVGTVKVWVGIARKIGRGIRALEARWRITA